jgi:hypothetical protein
MNSIGTRRTADFLSRPANSMERGKCLLGLRTATRARRREFLMPVAEYFPPSRIARCPGERGVTKSPAAVEWRPDVSGAMLGLSTAMDEAGMPGRHLRPGRAETRSRGPGATSPRGATAADEGSILRRPRPSPRRNYVSRLARLRAAPDTGPGRRATSLNRSGRRGPGITSRRSILFAPPARSMSPR